ncbi:MAG: YncE family protein [Paludibacteraceae bacterium]|nr:YncE family protein [Paludibacteraceae bacterium]
MNRKLIYIASISLLVAGCRTVEPVTPPEEEQKGDTVRNEIAGFYLLNEGNMGSNKSTLDYYDYATATYSRDIYAEANPNVPKELGDVGNDLKIYGGRLYAVINCSNKVEVLDARTCKRIGQVDIPNCRYITFDGRYAYVTSYAGPVSLDASHAQIGYVARFDTAALQIDATCLVGYQPDEPAVVGGKLYVANSGGYMVPDYDSTVSVIDLTSFTETKRITVAKNLWRVRADRYGQLWVSSRGDYYDTPAKLYCIDTNTDRLVDSVSIAVSALDIAGDSLYACATAWDYVEMDDVLSYSIVNVRTRETVSTNFITDGTDAQIQKPYGIKVNPLTGDIYVTDAKNYVNPGMLHCYSPAGKLQWSVRTGDIPAQIAFLYK